jgi:hypothetical protein
MFENINFIDDTFFSSLPENIIIIGGDETGIDVESKLNNFDCVIRVNNRRAIKQIKKNIENGILNTKTDYIYSWYKRSLEHNEEILKHIPNLKGIITYADPYKLMDTTQSPGNELNSYESLILKKMYYKQDYVEHIDSNEQFRINDSIPYYIRFIDNNTNKLENIHICCQYYPNLILENNGLKQYYGNDKIYGFTSGLKLIFILLKYGKKITISGFNLDRLQAERFNYEKTNGSLYPKYVVRSIVHDWIIELNIINDLYNEKKIDII